MNVTIVDHMLEKQVENLISVLEAKGHIATVVNNADPRQAAKAVLKLKADVVLTDLKFEHVDDKVPLRDWWGCKIVRQLTKTRKGSQVPIVVWSRFIGKEDHAVLNSLGILSIHIIDRLDTLLRDVVATLEGAVAASRSQRRKQKAATRRRNARRNKAKKEIAGS